VWDYWFLFHSDIGIPFNWLYDRATRSCFGDNEMQIKDCVIGQEYKYLDQFVKLLEYWQVGEDTDVSCVIQTRFGQITTVDVSELSLKQRG
jgi:hypothetical protein